ncbi:MAG TPA: ester cyclase [bacterium]
MDTAISHPIDQPRKTQRDHERLAHSLIAAWNGREFDRFLGLFSPTYTGTDVNDPIAQEGYAGICRQTARCLEAFPDLRVSCEAVLADDARMAVLWTARGTHRGSYLHIPATHRPIEVRGVAVFTVAGGLIQHGLYVWDTAGVLRALGLLPHL